MRVILTLAIVAFGIMFTTTATSQPQYHSPYVDAYGLTHIQSIDYVRQVCDHAHREVSGASEQACGRAQQETGTEYLCNSTSRDALCWVDEL